MGRSITTNVLGYGKEFDGEDGRVRRTVYMAMNRLEIAQEIVRAAKYGDKIETWVNQTRIGARVLGMSNDPMSSKFYGVNTEDIPLPKTITCPVCGGKGSYLENHTNYFCSPCNGSGITTKAYLAMYQPWQLTPKY